MIRRCPQHRPDRSVRFLQWSIQPTELAQTKADDHFQSFNAAGQGTDTAETGGEEADRLALEAQLRSAFQLAKDVEDGVFDPRQVEIIHGVPQIYGYPWEDAHGRTFTRLSNRRRG